MDHSVVFTGAGVSARIIDLPAAAGAQLERLPVVMRVLLENVLRTSPDAAQAAAAAAAILDWLDTGCSTAEIEFNPGRVLMHDTTCGPALADIAAMRSAPSRAGSGSTRRGCCWRLATT